MTVENENAACAAPVQIRRAIVFWDGLGHFWTPDGATRHGPFTGPDSLDDAIGDARAAGYKIAEVNRTRGMMPAFGPQVAPADELATPHKFTIRRDDGGLSCEVCGMPETYRHPCVGTATTSGGLR